MKPLEICAALWAVAAVTVHAAAPAFPTPVNSEKSTTKALSPEEAAAAIRLPAGFKATVFASEPDVQQPISMCFDARGRLWVAEAYTYADQTLNYDLTLRDRIIVLEDPEGTGHFTKRTVFWDGAQRLTSVAVGMGGVYALALPNLLFIPDRDGDAVPDGEPQILLNGFEFNAARHTMANGLKWGPDGWLYGRQGIMAGTKSKVGPPNSSESARKTLGSGIWRYHPTRNVVEALTEGTTNPWGMDWDEYGEPFFINTVIGHLWYMIPGAHYTRMYGPDPGSRIYGVIPQFADHVHWDTRERWDEVRDKGVTDESSKAGGGHAHTGLMFYLGDSWPEKYRGKLFTINLHGRRLNMDRLERDGSGYAGKHGEDFAFMGDPWFRGIDLIEGPDGVYVADWSDTGECHDHDGVHRTSGRIFKITYGSAKPEAVQDVESASAGELATILGGGSEWKARQALRVIQARVAAKQDISGLRDGLKQLLVRTHSTRIKLRAMWALSLANAITTAELTEYLRDSDEHLRVWAFRLLMDEFFLPGVPTFPSPMQAAFFEECVRLAGQDPSPLVRLAVASALRNLPSEGALSRARVGSMLLLQADDANDHSLPLMIWYGLSSMPVATMVELATGAKMALFRRFAARRMAEDYDSFPDGLDNLLKSVTQAENAEDILQGVAEGFIGRRKVSPPPPAWREVADRFGEEPKLETRVRDLSALFGDGRALGAVRDVALNASLDNNSRLAALQVLINSEAPDLRATCEKLLDTRDLAATACAGLARFDDPAVADLLIKKLPSFYGHEKPAAISVLVGRPSFASKLLDAIAANKIPAKELTPFQARQIRELKDPALSKKLADVWGEVRDSSAEKKKLLATWKAKLTPETLAKADLSKGRTVFAQACASCHKLYGEGAAIGPDLTGSGRANLDYLLENLSDPSAVVPADYRMVTLQLRDGRNLTGVIAAKTSRSLMLQTPTEKFPLDRREIKQTIESNLSMMPDGLLEGMSEAQVRDLVAYLMAPGQVPLEAK